MNVPTRLTAVILAVTLVGCAGARISFDYDPEAVAAMRAYRTYSWLPERRGAPGAEYRVNNPITIRMIKAGVDQELQAKGYEKVDSDGDFSVGWHGVISDQTNYATYNDYYGYDQPTTTLARKESTIPQGSLIVDVVDNPSNELVWRSAAQAGLGKSGSPEERQTRINEACRELFSSFPPEP
jgi:hypothetical protein